VSKPVKLMKIRLIGGPLDGAVVEVPRRTRVYRVGMFWTYEHIQAVDGTAVFGKRPRSRPLRRALKLTKRITGKDARVEYMLAKAKPLVYPGGRRIARRKRMNERRITRRTA
jgi:hypothetical protein